MRGAHVRERLGALVRLQAGEHLGPLSFADAATIPLRRHVFERDRHAKSAYGEMWWDVAGMCWDRAGRTHREGAEGAQAAGDRGDEPLLAADVGHLPRVY